MNKSKKNSAGDKTRVFYLFKFFFQKKGLKICQKRRLQKHVHLEKLS